MITNDNQINEAIKSIKLAVDRVNKINFNDYNPEAAKRKKKELIRTPRLKLLKILRDEMDLVERAIGQIKGETYHRCDITPRLCPNYIKKRSSRFHSKPR